MICSLMRASTKPKVSARVPDVPVKIHYQNSTERSAWRLEIPSGRQNKLYVYTEPQILEELINWLFLEYFWTILVCLLNTDPNQ